MRVRDLVVVWALISAGTSCGVVAQDLVADPSTPSPLSSFKDCEACPEMIVMPLGSFMMGALPEESRNRFDIYGPNATRRIREQGELNIIPNEHPRHLIEMDIPFAIARNETTYAEWMVCVRAGGCGHIPDHQVLTPGGYVALGPKHPVINVSYLDVLEYVTWLNAQVGSEVYRLPTEAEWEYAARSGTITPFAQGANLTSDQANFSRGATEHILGVARPDLVSRFVPVQVDELDAANAWGIRHMSGNVQELTVSCASEQHLGLSSDALYLDHSESQSSCLRVAKGGAYNTALDGIRLAARAQTAEDRRRDTRGFRVIRELDRREDNQ